MLKKSITHCHSETTQSEQTASSLISVKKKHREKTKLLMSYIFYCHSVTCHTSLKYIVKVADNRQIIPSTFVDSQLQQMLDECLLLSCPDIRSSLQPHMHFTVLNTVYHHHHHHHHFSITQQITFLTHIIREVKRASINQYSNLKPKIDLASR